MSSPVLPPSLAQLIQSPSAQPNLAPQQPAQPDLASIFMQMFQKVNEATARDRALGQQAAQVPQAPSGFQPNFVHGEGAKGFFHNVGQGLEAVGASTRPGQAIMETVQAPAQARRAQSLQAIKSAQDPEVRAEDVYSKGAEGAGRLAYEQGMLGIRQDSNQIRKQQADTSAKAQASRAADMLVRQAQGWQNLDVKKQSNAIRQAFDQAVIPIMQERISAGMDENSARIQAQEDVKAALSQNQYAVQHPILSMLGISPDLTSAPAAGTPKPIQAKPKGQSGKRVIDLTK